MILRGWVCDWARSRIEPVVSDPELANANILDDANDAQSQK